MAKVKDSKTTTKDFTFSKEDQTSQQRKKLIDTAVTFLLNPSILSSPSEKKFEFLRKKGLSEEEIRTAFELASISPEFVPSNKFQNSATALAPQQNPISVWSRLREWFTYIVFIGGISYSSYLLIKRYLMPYFFKIKEKESEQSEALNRLEVKIDNLSTQIGSALDKVTEVIQKQELNSYNNTTPQPSPVKENQISELKSEVRSLKSLLLNRNQFPKEPVVNPVLPAWQQKSIDSLPPVKQQSENSSAKPLNIQTSDSREDDKLLNDSLDTEQHTQNKSPLKEVDFSESNTSLSEVDFVESKSLLSEPVDCSENPNSEQITCNGDHS